MADERHDSLGARRRRNRRPHARRPRPVGQHDERGLQAVDGCTVVRLEAERDEITGVVITSAKKTFFAGGDLNDLGWPPRSRPARCRPRCASSRHSSAAWRRSASRSSRRSTAPRSAAGWRSAWPATTGSHSMNPRCSWASPRCSSDCSQAPAAWCARCGCSGSSTRCWRCCCRASDTGPARPRSSGSSTSWWPPVRSWCRPPRRGSRPTPRRMSSRGTRRLQDPGRHAVEPEVCRRTCRRSRPTCESSSRAPTSRRRTTSWPRRSRARSWTSTTRSRSRAATSSTWSPARSPRT